MILRDLCHPGIVTLHSSFSEKKRLYLVLDYALNGDLSTVLAKGCFTDFKVKQYYIAQMVQILAYLRENKIVHRDLKPANFLVNENWHLMLADFGKAVKLSTEDKLEVMPCVKKVNS